MRAYRVQVLPLPPYRPSQPLSQIPLLPVAVLTFILSLIPQTSVLKFALLSRDFLSAAQTVLYGNLDMQDVRNSDALWIFLVSSHARPLCPCMAIRTDPGVSHTLRTVTHGQPPLYNTSFF